MPGFTQHRYCLCPIDFSQFPSPSPSSPSQDAFLYTCSSKTTEAVRTKIGTEMLHDLRKCLLIVLDPVVKVFGPLGAKM